MPAVRPATTGDLAALFAADRSLLERHLLQDGPPSEQALVDASRLLLRYQNHPGGATHVELINTLLSRWNLDTTGLFSLCRSIWASNWRPSAMEQQEAVGSGADVGADS